MASSAYAYNTLELYRRDFIVIPSQNSVVKTQILIGLSESVNNHESHADPILAQSQAADQL